MLVSHTHWDREWYRSFQEFRARLVDTVDVVLDLLDQDPGWTFVLDGQTIVRTGRDSGSRTAIPTDRCGSIDRDQRLHAHQ